MFDRIQAAIQNIKTQIEQHRKTFEANEAQTRKSLIEPLLDSLGWDTSDVNQVIAEYQGHLAGMKSGQFVDYALFLNRKPIVVLEAKSLNTSLTNVQALKQLRDYFQGNYARVGILTNGTEYQIYSDLDRKNLMDETPFLSVDIANMSARDFDILLCFSRDRFNLENAKRLSEEIRYLDNIRERFKKIQANDDDSFLRWLMGEVYEGRNTKESKKWFADLVREAQKDAFTVAESFDSKQTDGVDSPPREDPIQPITLERWTALADFEGVSRTDAPQVIRFKDGEMRPISQWNELLREIAQFLVDKGLLTAEQCPIKAGIRAKNYLVHTEPQNISGRLFSGPKYLSNGLALETAFNAKNTVNMSRFLLDYFGNDPSQVWLKTG